MAKPCRLKPGVSTVAPAIEEESGDMAVDPDAKLRVLRHWAQVFKVNQFNLEVATAWFDKNTSTRRKTSAKYMAIPRTNGTCGKRIWRGPFASRETPHQAPTASLNGSGNSSEKRA